MSNADRTVETKLLNVPLCRKHVIRIGIQSLNDETVVGTQRRSEMPVSATKVDDQTTQHAGGVEDFLAAPRRVCFIALGVIVRQQKTCDCPNADQSSQLVGSVNLHFSPSPRAIRPSTCREAR